MQDNDKILIAKLRQLHGVQPDREWRVLFKEKMFAQISVSKSESVHSAKRDYILEAKEKIAEKLAFLNSLKTRLFPGTMNLSRPAFAVTSFALIIAIFGGVFVFDATAKSLPGDNLYFLKLAGEKVRYALTLDEQQHLALRLEFLNNRFSEVDQSLSRNDSPEIKAERVEVAVNAIRQGMTDLNSDFDKSIAVAKPQKAVEMAKNVDESIDTYNKNLSAAETKLPESIKKKVKSSVTETIKIAEETSYKTLAILVENHASNPVISTDELAQKLEQKIEKTEAKLQDIQVKSQTFVNEPAKNNTDLNNSSTYSTATGTKPGDGATDTTADVLSSKAKEMLTDARIKLQLKDLSGALSNTTASDSIVNATEKILSSPNSTPDTISPTSTPADSGVTATPMPSITPSNISENPYNNVTITPTPTQALPTQDHPVYTVTPSPTPVTKQ